MAYRRKLYRRRRAPIRRRLVRRKRFFRRRRSGMRRGDSLMLKVRSIRNITLTDSTPNYSEATGWSLDDFTAGGEVASAASLYQQYKINMVTVRYIPRDTVADINNAVFSGVATGTTIFQAGWRNGTVTTCIDFDNGNPLAAQADAIQYNSMRMTPVVKPWKLIIRPKFKVAIYNDLAQSIGAQLSNGWLSTDNNGLAVLYRGFKMLFADCKGSDPGALPDLLVGQILTTVYASFRKRR